MLTEKRGIISGALEGITREDLVAKNKKQTFGRSFS